jgi:hypothetical protein
VWGDRVDWGPPGRAGRGFFFRGGPARGMLPEVPELVVIG